MAYRVLTKDAQLILDAVNKFGCVDYEQLKYFIESTKETDANGTPYSESIANHLSYTKQAFRLDNTLCSMKEKRRTIKMIDSIWAVLYLLSQTDDAETEETSQAEILANDVKKGRGYCTVEMFYNHNTWVKILPCYNSDDVMTILAEQENYEILMNGLKERKKMPTQYYLITRNKEALAELSKYEIKIPASVMLLSGEEGEQPEIRVGHMKQ